ncbi:Conserved_hypothetical protein [Hexamita inflata]|uniref:Uncharacterized protein n=1 Tax=Hexamita inflata TaxID=28002 RepID=A0ABP1HBL7_9EUKA
MTLEFQYQLQLNIEIPEQVVEMQLNSNYIVMQYESYIDVCKIDQNNCSLQSIIQRFQRSKIQSFSYCLESSTLYVVEDQTLWEICVNTDNICGDDLFIEKLITSKNITFTQQLINTQVICTKRIQIVCTIDSFFVIDDFQIIMFKQFDQPIKCSLSGDFLVILRADGLIYSCNLNSMEIKSQGALGFCSNNIKISEQYVSCWDKRKLVLYRVQNQVLQQISQIELEGQIIDASFVSYVDKIDNKMHEVLCVLIQNDGDRVIFALQTTNFNLQSSQTISCNSIFNSAIIHLQKIQQGCLTTFYESNGSYCLQVHQLILFQTDLANENKLMVYPLIFDENKFKFQFGDAQVAIKGQVKDDGEIQQIPILELPETCCLNPKHPNIVSKQQKLQDQKKIDSKINKPVMYHQQQKSTLNTRIQLSDKHQLKFKQDQASQSKFEAKIDSKLQTNDKKQALKNLPTKLQNLNNQSIYKCVSKMDISEQVQQIQVNSEVVSLVQQKSVQLFQYSSQQKKFKFINSISIPQVPKQVSLHSQSQLLLCSELQGYSIYDCSTKAKLFQQQFQIGDFDPKVFKYYEPNFVSFLWPNHEFRTLVVSGFMNELNVNYFQFKEGDKYSTFQTTVLKHKFEQQIVAGCAYSQQKSQNVYLGYNNNSNSAPVLQIFDLIRLKSSYDLLSCNSQLKNISQICVNDRNQANSNLFALFQQGTENEVEIRDFRVQNGIRHFKFIGKRKMQPINFINNDQIAFATENAIMRFDIRSGKIEQVSGSLKVSGVCGFQGGVLCGVEKEVGFWL